jgi:hypothetical protein
MPTDRPERPERPASERPPDDDLHGRRIVERILPEIVKRAVEVGVEKLAEGPESLRHLVGERKLPKELVTYLFSQVDETKNGLYRVVAKEIRDFLEHTNVAEELTRALTKLSFEVKTEIRFVPNDAAPGEGARFPKPDVRASVHIKPDPPEEPAPKSDRPSSRPKDPKDSPKDSKE